AHGGDFGCGRYFLPVPFVFDCPRDALGLLRAAVGFVRKGRLHLPEVHRHAAAAWDFGTADRRDPGGGDVESERRAEFAVLELDDGFLPATPSADRRSHAAAAIAHLDILL